MRREDGDGRVSMVFTDCLGRQVLSRKVLSDGEFADTYTVCDAWGNPLIVIPPELSSQGGGTTGYVSTNLIREYAFIRSYDRKHRLRMSKMPGCEPVRYAYDADNRLVLSRDGNQSVDGTMSFVLRDALGREVLAGTCTSENGDVFDIGSDDLEPPVCSLSASTTATSGSLTGTAVSGYAVSGGSLSLPENAQVLTAGYYDGYSFFSGGADSPFAAVASHCAAPVGALTSPKGLLTATLSAVSGKGGVSKLLPCVNYYDEEERLVRSVELTHRGDILTRDFTYSMAGMKLSEKQTLLMPDGTSHSVMTSNAYDAFGRLTSATASFDGGPEQTLHRMAFDALGRVIVDSIPANTTSFEYDCHGWTTQIGRTGLMQNYYYADGANPSYSGKITLRSINQTVIRNKRKFTSKNIYSYEYDALGRLSSAAFTRNNGTALTSTDFSTSYGYDLNSNITQISRNGLIATNTYGEIDNVSLSFSGNQLTSMTEEAGTVLLENSLDIPEGIWENGDFEYDANGNQTRDMSRDIEDIQYDSCNRPVKVTTADEEIDFLYSADGTKLAQIIPENDIRRDYCGAFELCDGVLERVHVDNGFFTAADSVLHVYLRDIQGGVLAVYNTAGAQMEQIVETYPYGMPHSSGTLSEVDVNRRWFGGKEFTAESGVNLYDFNARWLNPALAMFTTPDPLAFNTPDVSPYTFCAGDPVNYTDPTGKEVVLFATTLPGLKYDVLNFATHTFIAIIDTNGSMKAYFSYGPEKGDFPILKNGGRLMRMHYKQDYDIMRGTDKIHLKARIQIPTPDGMSNSEFEQRVIDTAESFGNQKDIIYQLFPNSSDAGNCNSSTSTILRKSGVSENTINKIHDMIPGISAGFSTFPKPWTTKEQQKALQEINTLKNKRIFTYDELSELNL